MLSTCWTNIKNILTTILAYIYNMLTIVNGCIELHCLWEYVNDGGKEKKKKGGS